MSTCSEEQLLYLKRIKKRKIFITISQILIITIFIIIWELLSRFNLINSFLSSSPSKVLNTIINLIKTNSLLINVWATLYETIISFFLASLLGFIFATILWWNKFLADTLDPYLTIFNSLPKVALGPLIIIWVGANTNSIIFMALMISLIITIINIYNGFLATDSSYIALLKSFNASKFQIYKSVIVPSNRLTIVNCLKINISMSLIGVIMGELLVSRKGLGYLIMYGSQVFNINLVITSVVVLALISYIMYEIINVIEKKILSK